MYYRNLLNNKMQEYFYVLYLDNKKKIIENKLLYVGTINKSIAHPREIFKEAYLLSASSIICMHNHPSNDVTPSKNDISLTNHLIIHSFFEKTIQHLQDWILELNVLFYH